jgi:hypothetical protein
LERYFRDDGRIIIKDIRESGSEAAKLPYIFTLGVIPSRVSLTAEIEKIRDDRTSEILDFNYKVEYHGWITLLMAFLPGWDWFYEERDIRENATGYKYERDDYICSTAWLRSFITIINKEAEKTPKDSQTILR